MEIDRIDRSILSLLQKNNRIANIDLAEAVGLSPPACLKRVKRLREGKIIVGDVALINPALAGNKMTLIVSVEMERDRGISTVCLVVQLSRLLKSHSVIRSPEAMTF